MLSAAFIAMVEKRADRLRLMASGIVWLLAASNDTCFGDRGFETRGSFASAIRLAHSHTEQ